MGYVIFDRVDSPSVFSLDKSTYIFLQKPPALAPTTVPYITEVFTPGGTFFVVGTEESILRDFKNAAIITDSVSTDPLPLVKARFEKDYGKKPMHPNKKRILDTFAKNRAEWVKRFGRT